MSAPAITVEPSSTVSGAAQIMIEHGINRLPVLLDERLVGILTRFDLVRAFARSDGEIEREIREGCAVSPGLRPWSSLSRRERSR